ncbi:MAG: LysM domain-containing protein [Anaerolineaceae bacterium]|nr:LysM domain-containing protein [Anaerolineaceae bacterium]
MPRPPSLMTCGFPGPGNLDVLATYQLYADCTLTGRINISEGVEVRVVGNGRVLRSSHNSIDIYLAANSRLRLENIRLDGVRIFSWGKLDARQIRVINARNASLFNLGSASFNNALFEDNVATSATFRSVLLAWNAYQDGFTSIRDSALRNNHGGVGALQIVGATLELHGCVTFENNMPTDYSGAVTDNRDPDCDDTIVDPTVLVVVPGPRPHVDNWHGPKKLPPDCFHRLGAIGLLCRPEGALEPEVQVWGVTDFSEGHFILRVAQSQADAAPGGSMVTHSPDNRVGVVVWPDRNITFSMGPNHEGKVHHATLPRNLSDHLVEAVTVHGGAPGVPPVPAATSSAPPLAPRVEPQGSRADGSLVHVVREGDTLWTICVTCGLDAQDMQDLVERNGLGDGGRLLRVGQELRIREADGA